MAGLGTFIFAALPLVAFGSVLPRATSDTFSLFAYGPGIGGLPIFYANGYAYAGNHNLSNSSDAANVVFSTGTNNTWLGNPNTTDLDSTPAWSNVTFYVPDDSTEPVGFMSSNSSTNSSLTTTGFRFYGNTAMLLEGGSLESLFTAMNTSDDGIKALYWNDTSSGQVFVSLRKAPPTMSALTKVVN